MKLAVLAIATTAFLGIDVLSQPVANLTLDPQTLSFTKSFRAKSLITETEKPKLPAPITLRAELTELFKGNGCTLPAKLTSALKSKTGSEALIPNELVDAFQTATLDAQLQKFPDQTVNAVLHSVTIPIDTGKTRQLSLVGAESYKSRSVADFLDPEASDFAFTMDCSGYLNAALRMDVSVPTSQLTQASDGALKSTRSLVVMRGHIFSPSAAAMDPSLGGAGLNDRQRIGLLYAIVAEVISDGVNRRMEASDQTAVTAWRKIDVIWTSNNGESSLTGKASIAGSGNVGLGLASVSASAGAGGSVSRQMTYKSFNTYILDSKVLEPVQRKLGVLKGLLQDEVRRMRASSRSTVNSAVEVLYPSMPEIPCKLKWVASTPTNATAGSVETSWSDAGCKVIFTKVPGLADKSVLELKAPVFGMELSFLLPMT
ncbi:hypothetical protein [Comamonas terrigena]|uniref:hypothetical protein n=1 Tax=Comamonas terrigena TaxID=32013 RepID=UPI00244C5566|nr:hypothetical protein [Comamonas terrigena]MDH1701442.1 hypothetical protein [Comamonas terrigena]